MMRAPSIRVRLTFWYTAILAVILVLFAAGVYFTLERTLRAQLDDTLGNRSTLVQELIAFDANGAPDLEGPTPTEELDPEDGFQRLFDAYGAVLFDNSQGFGDIPADEDAIARALSGAMAKRTADGDRVTLRIIAVPVRNGGNVVGVLEVAESTGDVEETLSQLLLIFAVAVPAALVLAALGGWWLSSRALEPIDRITRTAKEISDQRDLSRRIALEGSDDEVGRLARTFDEMIAQLEAAFQRQRQFTSDASHELRTPLTAVRGQIEVALRQERSGEEYRRVLGEVDTQADRMTRLSEGLLMLARSDAGAMRLDRERVDVRGLVTSVRDQIRAPAEAKGLELSIDAAADAVIEGDEGLLLQMLLNLADNAVKYTERGSVTLGWQRTVAGVEVFVRDTGPGIAAEDQGRVFERFHRGDVSRSSGVSGLGLGLAIARSIAEAHGATLNLRAEDGAGSVFFANFP